MLSFYFYLHFSPSITSICLTNCLLCLLRLVLNEGRKKSPLEDTFKAQGCSYEGALQSAGLWGRDALFLGAATCAHQHPNYQCGIWYIGIVGIKYHNFGELAQPRVLLVLHRCSGRGAEPAVTHPSPQPPEAAPCPPLRHLLPSAPGAAGRRGSGLGSPLPAAPLRAAGRCCRRSFPSLLPFLSFLLPSFPPSLPPAAGRSMEAPPVTMMPVTGGTINMMEYLLQGARPAGSRPWPGGGCVGSLGALGGCLGCVRGCLGCAWGVWEVFGVSLGCVWGTRAVLGMFGVCLGYWGCGEGIWGVLGVYLGCLGCLWSVRGVAGVFRVCWGCLGHLGCVEGVWGVQGVCLGYLGVFGVCLGYLGCVWGVCGLLGGWLGYLGYLGCVGGAWGVFGVCWGHLVCVGSVFGVFGVC